MYINQIFWIVLTFSSQSLASSNPYNGLRPSPNIPSANQPLWWSLQKQYDSLPKQGPLPADAGPPGQAEEKAKEAEEDDQKKNENPGDQGAAQQAEESKTAAESAAGSAINGT